MATPRFILELRERIGHDTLWLVGVTAHVEDGAGRVLLGRRADNGRWALVSGINEPGEEPADTAVRECLEECGVDVEPVALAAVSADPRVVTYPNGDRTHYLDLLFSCRLREGGEARARVADDESLEVGWFSPDALPSPMTASSTERIALVAEWRRRSAEGDGSALFRCTLAGGGGAA